MKYLKTLFILLLFSSCNQEKSNEEVENSKTGITKEQIARFEECKSNIGNLITRLEKADSTGQVPASTIKFYSDIQKMNLEEIVIKYKFKPYQIESFLRSICISEKISNAFDKLDRKLEESNKLIQDIEDSLMKEFDYSEIAPLPSKVKIPENIRKKGGKYKYVDEKGDTIIVTVKVAKYEE